MDTKYHQIIAVLSINNIPALKTFFDAQNYPVEKIMEDAVRPDHVYHDNIAQTSEVHFAHSYKQGVVENKLKWLAGDGMERVKALAIDLHNYRQNDDWALMCRFIGEWTHYAVDVHTYPHLVKGKPWSEHHIAWEMTQAKWLVKHQDEIGPLVYTPFKDIYKAFVADARMMYYHALKVVDILENGQQMTDEQNIVLARLIATSVGSGLLSITQKFWPTE